MNISGAIAAGTKKKGPQSRRNAIAAGARGVSVQDGDAATLGMSRDRHQKRQKRPVLYLLTQKQDASENSEPGYEAEPPAQPKKKKKRAGRGPEWDEQEIFLLVKAVMGISTDAAVGTDQSGPVCWARSYATFEQLKAIDQNERRKKGVKAVEYPERQDADAIKKFWSSSVLPAFNKFTGICSNNKPTSGENDTDTYYNRMVVLYKNQVKGVKGVPKSFDRFLAAYRIANKHPKFSSHFKDGEGHTPGKTKKTKGRPEQGRDATKLDNKARAAAAGVKDTLEGFLKDAEASKAKRFDEMMSLLFRGQMNQAMMTMASPEEKAEYFKTVSETAIIQAKADKKRAELSELKITAEVDRYKQAGEVNSDDSEAVAATSEAMDTDDAGSDDGQDGEADPQADSEVKSDGDSGVESDLKSDLESDADDGGKAKGTAGEGDAEAISIQDTDDDDDDSQAQASASAAAKRTYAYDTPVPQEPEYDPAFDPNYRAESFSSMDSDDLKGIALPLKAGDTIQYYDPIGVVGDKRWLREATIVSVQPNHGGLILSDMTVLPEFFSKVKQTGIENKNGVVVPYDGVWRGIDDYEKIEGRIGAVTNAVALEAARFQGIMRRNVSSMQAKAEAEGFAPMDALVRMTGVNDSSTELVSV